MPRGRRGRAHGVGLHRPESSMWPSPWPRTAAGDSGSAGATARCRGRHRDATSRHGAARTELRGSTTTAGLAQLSGSISIAATTARRRDRRRRRTLERRRLGRRLRRRLRLRPRVDTRDRATTSRARPITAGAMSTRPRASAAPRSRARRRSHASRPEPFERNGLDHVDAGRRAADHPGGTRPAR